VRRECFNACPTTQSLLGLILGASARVPAERLLAKRSSFVGKRVSLQAMSICARTSYRGYRYYRLPNGIPEAAARG
jgi:hypothetical protein